MTNFREYFQETTSGEPLAFYFCGWEKCTPGHAFGPAVRPHYLFHLVLSGRGIYERGRERYEVRAGQGFLIPPGESTCYEADRQDPWEYCWVGFGGTEAEGILRECGLGDENLIYQDHSGGLLLREMMGLMDSFGLSEVNSYMLLGKLYLILSRMVKRTTTGEKADLGYVNGAVEFIRNNFSYDIGVKEIARHVGIDRTYLYRLFQRQLGQSPKTYLTQFRLRIAAEMLAETELPVTEVALSCGFPDISLLERHFRQAYRCTPLQYRRKKR